MRIDAIDPHVLADSFLSAGLSTVARRAEVDRYA
jgi:hypothetical protein